jgi:hypothetical protein
MNSARVLYRMVLADFLERARRYSFLLTLAGALYLAYGVATEQVWIVIGRGYRGVYNSAWIGALTAICCTTFLSLIGFYIVKNSLLRDAETRVGQILAATPMRKSFYTLAKALSNFAVLGSMVVVLMPAAIAMQVLHGEVQHISLWSLWSPFLLLALPSMAITASVAVLFETIPGLRGGFGNVLYFFLWTTALGLGVGADIDEPTGMRVAFRSMHNALLSVDPTSPSSFSLTIGGQRAVRTFYWDGIHWTPTIILTRLLWVLVAAGVALLASLFFHRFDPAYEWKLARSKSTTSSLPAASEETISHPQVQPVHLTRVARGQGQFRFAALVVSELRLMLKGLHFWWYIVAAGLFIGCLASPPEVGEGVLIAAWIWPILVWSNMGSREVRYSTGSLIFSSPRPLLRQLPATWAAGVLVAVLTGGGLALRLLLAADWHALAGWLAGALFIPTLALALGVWSNGGKFFEALYTIWWYVGPMHQTPQFDFMGTTPASSSPALYFVLTAILLAAAYLGRRTRLAYA